MRARTLAALAALLLPAVPTVAAPPASAAPDVVRAWIIEWAGGSKPAVQNGEITFTWRRDRSIYVVVPFDVRAGRRDLSGGVYLNFVGPSSSGHYYPSVWAEGHGDLVPACPASAACSDPFAPLPRDPETRRLFGNMPNRYSFYVVAQNFGVHKITTSPGWKAPREIKPAPPPARLIRNVGTGARANATGIEHFTGATTPGGRTGSVAIAPIACAFNMGTGSIVLKGGDPLPPFHDDIPRGSCADPYDSVAWGAANRATTWRVDGEVTGYTAIPDRLAVVDLPRFP